MNTIGKVLNQARRKKRISLRRLSEKTKIKENFLRALEKEEWPLLPNFAVTQGFVRSVAGVLGTNPETAVALLRRDYEEKEQTITSKKKTIIWTPKTTIILAAVASLVVIGLYLFYQYKTFVAPPPLTISQVKREGSGIKISGRTMPEAQILVNGEPLLGDDNGNFELILTSAQPGEKITIESRSRSGKSTKKEIQIP